jgi:hypothetical protein
VVELEKEMEAQDREAKWRTENKNKRITEATRKQDLTIDQSQSVVTELFDFLEKTPSEASFSSEKSSSFGVSW